MREITKKQVSITNERIFCDLCGKDVGPTIFYDISNVQLSFERGDNYPDGGHTEVTEYDCCGDCFHIKVRPALESLGLKPHEREERW